MDRLNVQERKKHKYILAFTLLELLVVIAIIGVLASIILASVNSVRAKARDVRRLRDMKSIQYALEEFYSAKGRYPSTQLGDDLSPFGECIGAGVTCGSSNKLEELLKPYLNPVPKDPLHNCPDASANCSITDYFYAYDSSHAYWSESNCQGTRYPGDGNEGAVAISINKLETNTYERHDICEGTDMQMDTADYSIIICGRSSGQGCGAF